jgi:hypothetical protein
MPKIPAGILYQIKQGDSIIIYINKKYSTSNLIRPAVCRNIPEVLHKNIDIALSPASALLKPDGKQVRHLLPGYRMRHHIYIIAIL